MRHILFCRECTQHRSIQKKKYLFEDELYQRFNSDKSDRTLIDAVHFSWSVRSRVRFEHAYNQWEMNKALLNAFAKRLVLEKLVNM